MIGIGIDFGLPKHFLFRAADPLTPSTPFYQKIKNKIFSRPEKAPTIIVRLLRLWELRTKQTRQIPSLICAALLVIPIAKIHSLNAHI
jgi:hypothetical protein